MEGRVSRRCVSNCRTRGLACNSNNNTYLQDLEFFWTWPLWLHMHVTPPVLTTNLPSLVRSCVCLIPFTARTCKIDLSRLMHAERSTRTCRVVPLRSRLKRDAMQALWFTTYALGASIGECYCVMRHHLHLIDGDEHLTWRPRR